MFRRKSPDGNGGTPERVVLTQPRTEAPTLSEEGAKFLLGTLAVDPVPIERGPDGQPLAWVGDEIITQTEFAKRHEAEPTTQNPLIPLGLYRPPQGDMVAHPDGTLVK